MREIGDISKQMLSRTLRRLEQDGFLRRTVYAEVPPRVEYDLTDLGPVLRQGLVRDLVRWADTHHGAIVQSRRNYAGPSPPQNPAAFRAGLRMDPGTMVA